MSMTGKCILITGASKGIGAEAARVFAEALGSEALGGFGGAVVVCTAAVTAALTQRCNDRATRSVTLSILRVDPTTRLLAKRTG